LKHTLLATHMELYNRPANLFVAGFIGSPAIDLTDGMVDAQGVARMTWVDTGVRLPQQTGRPLTVGMRPEDRFVQTFAADKVHVFDAAGGLRLN
jgi:ABC-type sugar transport system ATPase subunit